MNILTLPQEKEQEKGTDPFPSSFIQIMSSDATTQVIEQMLGALLEDNPEIFLVEVKIKPTNNVKIFLDADGGISISKCVTYNRALYKQIEAEGIFPDGDFSLEVSSPGLEEPLKLKRQYQKNIGRNVEVTLQDSTKIEGKLLTVGEKEILVEEIRGKNKKKETIQHTIFFDNIKTTKIQIQF